jgi:hypothetical protein
VKAEEFEKTGLPKEYGSGVDELLARKVYGDPSAAKLAHDSGEDETPDEE